MLITDLMPVPGVAADKRSSVRSRVFSEFLVSIPEAYVTLTAVPPKSLYSDVSSGLHGRCPIRLAGPLPHPTGGGLRADDAEDWGESISSRG